MRNITRNYPLDNAIVFHPKAVQQENGKWCKWNKIKKIDTGCPPFKDAFCFAFLLILGNIEQNRRQRNLISSNVHLVVNRRSSNM
jgi:hypothetical protein